MLFTYLFQHGDYTMVFESFFLDEYLLANVYKKFAFALTTQQTSGVHFVRQHKNNLGI